MDAAGAERWGHSLGQTLRGRKTRGAGGDVGAEFGAKSPGDGATLLIATVGTHAINPALYSNMPYNNVKDFTPVSFLASTPNLLVVHPGVKAGNLKELIALARAAPRELNFASAGNGSTSHLCGEALKVAAGIDITHVH